MSRVIKAAVWKDNPHLINTPEPPPPQAVVAAMMDDETRDRMMAEITAKEQRATEMIKEASVNAEIIRQEAQSEHDRLLELAQQQITELKEKAQQEGRKEGYEAGQKDGERKVREEMEAVIRAANAQAEKTLRDAKDASADYVQKAEKDVTTIAMSVVEKVLPQHFIDVPQVILPLVREAILKVKDQKSLIVHVPPASYGLVLMARDEFRSLLAYGDATIEVLSDDSMQPGDCLVETPNGSVDARLATQIEMLKQAVKDVML